ncbi:hypothetical protein EK904_002887 [Melospiza melodia maxima]|nr:hypothetical protein EK904_002887 [Melospiza melodia maxima]
MKAGAAALAAGILGGTGVLLFLIAFGTDYWLLATDTCGVLEHGNGTLSTAGFTFKSVGLGSHFHLKWHSCSTDTKLKRTSDIEQGRRVPAHLTSGLDILKAEAPTEAGNEILTFHHEGFFWRCWFFGEGHPESIWTFWYTSQAHPKFCMHGYLFPMPIAVGPFPHPSYDTTAGGLFLLLVFLFVMWKEFAADFQRYILLERSERCLDGVPVHVYYGWSFMFAAAGVPLALLSGLLFFLVGRDIMDSLQ